MKEKLKKAIPPVMPRLLMALVASVATLGLCAADAGQSKLLVGIVVDGLDADYLDLLRSHFGNSGFRLLEREGAVILNADYGGHLDAAASTALIVTGSAPSYNGIAAEKYYSREHLREMEAFVDANYLGNYTNKNYSPTALRVSTVSDEVRIAAGGTNVVYSVAPRAAQAISLGGHSANAAFWIDDKTGNWGSSTYYKDMPVFITTRNRSASLSLRLDAMSWTPSLSMEDYPGLPKHLTYYPFRYVFPRGSNDRYDMFMSSPLVNTEVTEVAEGLITTLHLGQHETVTDVLNLAYTLQPYVYGKVADNRAELMDAYIKLDQNLEHLFSVIDERVGLDNTVVVVSATAPRRQSRRDEEQWGVPYGEFSTRKAISLLNVYLTAVYGNGDYVTAWHRGHIYLNRNLLKEKSIDEREIRESAASFLLKMTGVDQVSTIDEIIESRAGDSGEALRRNMVLSQAGDLLLTVVPGFEIVDDFNSTSGSTQNSMVERTATTTAPVYIMAPNVASQTVTSIVDARAIAPTVCRILRIRSPNAAAGAPLSLKKK
ncbi:MAG: alkaline phosphatase family protein [Muribaculaceae bacterium]|nr:alkaline phosphatase family protein [Muribaculaceae bacterium]